MYKAEPHTCGMCGYLVLVYGVYVCVRTIMCAVLLQARTTARLMALHGTHEGFDQAKGGDRITREYVSSREYM